MSYLWCFISFLLLVLFPRNPCHSDCVRAPRLNDPKGRCVAFTQLTLRSSNPGSFDASHSGRDFWETTLALFPGNSNQTKRAPYLNDCVNEKVPAKIAWKSRVRVEALKSLDEFLNWHLGNETRSYLLRLPIVGVNYVYPQGWMGNFQELHGFFSPYQPLVGRVSGYQEDLDSTRCVLQAVIQNLSDKRLQSFAADEILAKVLAYRDLHLGEELLLPCCDQGKIELRSYKVDEVFNLWLGMPAYGLVPLDKGASLLLFRGTDFSLDAPRGWASLMSDVDLSGPGLHAFQKAQPKIHAWLKKCADSGSKARVMGYSLGGALAAYAYIFENEWIAEEGSCGFNLPGVSDLVIEQWNALCCKRQLGFVSFVNRGDVVSKVGKLFGEVYELSLDAPMKPMTAHTLLMCAQPFFDRNAVDVALENESRRVVSGTLQNDRAHAQSP